MYKPTIGLEIHAELKTNSKMFCSCKNDPDEKNSNVNICPVCTAQPGSLPVINEEAVKKVIKVGLALNCKIAEFSKFDRKNYFYPDLPKGYQISQYDMPFCEKGYLEIGGNGRKKIKITRIHLEEDTGRSVHDAGEDYSLVDFNRAGVPLMELVTEPDIESDKEAGLFAKELQLILRYLGVSEANMEKGQMRVEVNISLSDKPGTLGTKVEIKNLNSFRVVEKAINFEIKRQQELLEKGEKIIQETRGWHDVKEITFSQREKESAHDYRYFPEPDLPPLQFTKESIGAILVELPELPQKRRERFKEENGLNDERTEIFVQNKDLGEYFEKVVSEFGEQTKENLSALIKLASNYLITDLQGLLDGMSVKDSRFLITPEDFSEFINLIYDLDIRSNVAKLILQEMFRSGADPHHAIEDKGLVKVISESEIEDIIKDVSLDNKKAVEDFRAGKSNSLQFLIGKVMEKTQGKADPKMIADLLKKNL